MSNDNTVTVLGNLTRDVELRYTTSGRAVANLSIAQSDRRKNDKGEWEDGNTSFFEVVAWAELGEHAAESLTKGMRVFATGRMEMRTWENDEGEKRKAWELVAHDLGPSLRWGTAAFERAEREQRSAPAGKPSSNRREDPVYGDEEPF